jgi:hypothetical protein
VRRDMEAASVYRDREELKGEHPEPEDEDTAWALDFAACNLDDSDPFRWKRRDSVAARSGPLTEN